MPYREHTETIASLALPIFDAVHSLAPLGAPEVRAVAPGAFAALELSGAWRPYFQYVTYTLLFARYEQHVLLCVPPPPVLASEARDDVDYDALEAYAVPRPGSADWAGWVEFLRYRYDALRPQGKRPKPIDPPQPALDLRWAIDSELRRRLHGAESAAAICAPLRGLYALMNSDGAGSADLAAPVFYADPHELARALERLRDHVRADAIHATPTLLDGPIAPVDELEAVCSLLRGMPPGAAPLPTTRPTRVSAFCFVHHAIDGTSGHTSKLVRADIVLAQRGYRYVEIELWQRSVEGIYFS